jgi:outer membrane protein assembly factor BamB
MIRISFSLLLACAALDVRADDWPQWRGPNRDGLSTEKNLLKTWPDGGPKKLWTVSGLGGGYSTPSIANGLIFGMGKQGGDPTKKRGSGGTEHVWARSEKDGSPVWSTPIADVASVGYDEGSRSTPTFANGKVYAVATAGDLVCLDAKTGKEVWKKNYVKDFGGRVQSWGFSESVLVDGDAVVGTPGSAKAAFVKLNAATGDLIWQAEVRNPGGASGYSSPVKATIHGVEMYINLLGKSGGVVGVDAKTGKFLWQYARIMNGTANIPTVVVRGNHIFCSTGYSDGGSALIELTKSGNEFKVDEIVYHEAKKLQNHHGGMVLVGDHLYLGRGHNNGLPTCVDFKSGNIVWAEDSGAGRGNGSGCVTSADGMLYFRYQNGVVALVKATSSGFELNGRFEIPQPSGKPSWPHPVIANGKLHLRDQDKLHCYDIGAK